MVLSKVDSYMQKNVTIHGVRHFPTPWVNINSNWIKDLNGRPETTNHLEENMAINTLTLTLANFFWYVSSIKRNKQKSINGTTSSYKTFVQQRKLSIKQKKIHILSGRKYLKMRYIIRG